MTFCLQGSFPPSRVFWAANLATGEAFVAMDRMLDNPQGGPMLLSQPEIAEMVVQALFEGERRFGRYALHAFVIMSNRVHLLVTPHVESKKWLGPLKGFTAHRAIRMFNLETRPFWQSESYDRLIRDDEEFSRVKRYIEWNPVKAGLVALPEEFRWSSATPGRSPDQRGERSVTLSGDKAGPVCCVWPTGRKP